MERRTAGEFDQELLNLFDLYVHGDIDRRKFLERAAKFAVGGMTAAGLLDALSPRFAEAQQVAKDDKRLRAEWIDYESPQGTGKVRAYLARPESATGGLPGILVIHENRGLNPHIEDITRRLALDNFVALAPDALTPLGGYPGDEDKAREAFAKLDQAKTREDLLAGAGVLKARPECTGKIGVVGFCWGGTMANMLATRLPDLAAAVPFYGGQPAAADAARIKAPLLIHYADNDDRINSGWPAYEAALKGSGVAYTMYRYPGTQHGFNNDTTPRYDRAAAELALAAHGGVFQQESPRLSRTRVYCGLLRGLEPCGRRLQALRSEGLAGERARPAAEPDPDEHARHDRGAHHLGDVDEEIRPAHGELPADPRGGEAGGDAEHGDEHGLEPHGPHGMSGEPEHDAAENGEYLFHERASVGGDECRRGEDRPSPARRQAGCGTLRPWPTRWPPPRRTRWRRGAAACTPIESRPSGSVKARRPATSTL